MLTERPDTIGVSAGAQHAAYERPSPKQREAEKEVRQIESATAVNAAGTTEEVVIKGPRSGQAYLIERITLVSSGPTEANIYVGSVADGNLVDFAPDAQKGIADEVSPIYVPSGQDVIALFTGLAAQQVCTMRLQLRRVEG